MPTEHFKSPEAYRKWTAYRHIHGIPAPNLKTAVIAGKPHKVQHSELSLPEIHAKERGASKAKLHRMSEASEHRHNFYGE